MVISFVNLFLQSKTEENGLNSIFYNILKIFFVDVKIAFLFLIFKICWLPLYGYNILVYYTLLRRF